MKKYFIFDMDGSICESRTAITNPIKNALNKLPNVYVISGAARELMEKQLLGVKCTILAQNGNDTDKWQKTLSEKQKERILKHVNKIERKYKYCGGIADRGCQISYSFTGHNADLYFKKQFDPDKKIRNHILEVHPFKDKELLAFVAGNTCIDYINKNGTKGENLKEYLRDINKDECIYFGDNLQEGGNDSTVVGLMQTVPVNLDNVLQIIENYA